MDGGETLNFQVAIDGPAGSGKSSISKQIAKRLHFNHIDTGAMYRAVTLEALNRNISILEDSYSFLEETTIFYQNGSIYLNGNEVDAEIRSQRVSNAVSQVATISEVRAAMVRLQRQAASSGHIIMDGRDIGTVVLPDAQLKVFLDASVEERAKRRFLETTDPTVTLEQLKSEIEARDHNDRTRKLNPLQKAEDAVEIDTTTMTFEEVVKEIIKLIRERGNHYGIQF